MFYEGHLPAFSVIALLKRGLGQPGVDAEMERLFERGIDPDSVDQAVPRSGAGTMWPARDEVLAFGRRADEAIVEALGRAELDLAGGGHRAMRRGEAIFTALEHEAMHQETLLYMWHRLPHDAEAAASAGVRYERGGEPPHARDGRDPCRHRNARRGPRARFRSAGTTSSTSSASRWTRSRSTSHSVTNAEFLEFIDAGGYRTRELWSEAGWPWREHDGITHPAFWVDDANGSGLWRGMFENVPLPAAWPVYVSCEEAAAFARWRGRQASDRGRISPRRVRHAVGPRHLVDSERDFPWGDAAPMPRAATSTSRRGIRSLSARARGASAPGACTIWSATGGSGRRLSSRLSGIRADGVVSGVLR